VVICICRNIKESDYPNKEELIKRLYEPDTKCNKCIENLTIMPDDDILCASLNKGLHYEREEIKVIEEDR
jgi:hypothetical protein